MSRAGFHGDQVLWAEARVPRAKRSASCTSLVRVRAASCMLARHHARCDKQWVPSIAVCDFRSANARLA
jgi:hypothetical protein